MKNEYEVIYLKDDLIRINGEKFKRFYLNLTDRTTYFISKKAKVYNEKNNQFIKCKKKNKRGYYTLHMHINGNIKVSNLHRCVATVWKPSGFGIDKDVDHKDGDKNNNKPSNLEWVSRKVNIRRAYKIGLKNGLSGDNAPSTKYSDASVRIAFKAISEGTDIHKASRLSGIPKSYLYTMLRNEIRCELYNEFDFSRSKINHKKRKSKKEINEIKNMYNLGYTAKQVADRFNMSVNTVYSICKKRK